MLEQIGISGLYKMHEPICPSLPRECLPVNLDLPPLFDEAADELVLRLLEFSYERNAWVGVSWLALKRRLEQDLTLYLELTEQDRPNQLSYEQAKQKYDRLNRWTLHLYGLFRSPPPRPENPELARLIKRIPWSYHDRPQALESAAARLTESGYLKVEVGVYFLTSDLVTKYSKSKA